LIEVNEGGACRGEGPRYPARQSAPGGSAGEGANSPRTEVPAPCPDKLELGVIGVGVVKALVLVFGCLAMGRATSMCWPGREAVRYPPSGRIGWQPIAVSMYLKDRHQMSTTMVHVRVDKKTKQRAAKTLAGMGISVSDAVRMLLIRVAAEKALAFDVKVPNATTVKAMRSADKGKGKRLTSAVQLFKDLGM